jgi:Fe-S-cluster-containing dehydrogenase component
MNKWNLIIDIEKCEDCNNCFLACKDEHVGNDWPGYAVSQPLHGQRWMNIMRKERGQCPVIDVAYLPVPCMHCDNAPCIKAARDGAVYKRDDGIVIIDPIKARGQKDIVKSCPYEAIWWNAENDTPQKCTFCAHLMDDGWKAPRCVQACPTDALQVVQAEDSEMSKIIESENLEVWQPQYNTTPRVFYKNLYRYSRCFIGGSVAVNADGINDCATGARVTLIKDSKKIDETVTDGFGDFKFDNLEKNGGNYQLEIVYEDCDRKTVEVELKTSINVGDIYLAGRHRGGKHGIS